MSLVLPLSYVFSNWSQNSWPSEEFSTYRTESPEGTENLKWNSGCWSCCQIWHWKSPLWVLVSLNTKTIALLPFPFISLSFSVFIFPLHMFKEQKSNPLLHGNQEVIMQTISMIFPHLKACRTGRDVFTSCDWGLHFLYCQYYGNSFFEASSLLFPTLILRLRSFWVWNCIA